LGDLVAEMISYTPTHPDLFVVDFRPGAFQSSLKAVRSFKLGEIICFLTAAKPVAQRTWATVQCGDSEDLELNSDLVYVNHSCEPNIAFDVSHPDRSQWHARALREISAGDTLTFFYPSTEWDMRQPFECSCGTKSCMRHIAGASRMKKEDFDGRGFINEHILAKIRSSMDEARSA